MRRLTAVVVALTVGACAYTPRKIEMVPTAGAQSSKIFAADGSLITTLHAEQNRENVAFDDIPRVLGDAVLAIEDARFWEHRGVDVRAVLRAAVANSKEGEVVEGGSTITQQYVKNTMLDPSRTVNRKVEEALLAIELERRYSKERILELYLNTIYLGNGAYGVQAAAFEYFGVGVAELDLTRAATLAALIRRPSTTDPYDRPEETVERRNLVLDRMDELGWASRAEVDEAKAQPLTLAVKAPDDRYPAPHFVERVKQFVLDDERFGATRGERQALLFGGGLRIHTTLHLDHQAQAEEAVGRVLSQPDRDPDAAVVSMDPATGYVQALVGGRDFFGGGAQAKLDLATQGPGRPAGSAFKPLVLAAALEEGIRLSEVYDSPRQIDIPLTGQTWEVENYEGGGGGRSTLLEATVRSYNTVYAQVIQEVGPADAMAMAARLGVRSPLLPYPSAVLGTNDVHPIDMATAYGTLANRGLRVPPVYVTKVTTADGTVLYQHEHHQERVVERAVADQVTSVLRQVVERGTGVGARIGRPVAGKTGTGQEWRDAWFVGYTPDLVTAVWVGFAAEGRRSMVPPTTRVRVTGGAWPAQIWQLYMAAALAQVPVSSFPEPDPLPGSERDDGRELSLAELPDVVGQPAAQAEAALTRAGFVVERRAVPSDDYPPGYVTGQSPAAGQRAEGGSTVVIGVADGRPASTVVPSVLASSEEQAVAALRGAGFEVTVEHEAEPPAPGSERRAGLVWKQSPAGGGRAGTGSTVTVWVNPAPPAIPTPA